MKSKIEAARWIWMSSSSVHSKIRGDNKNDVHTLLVELPQRFRTDKSRFRKVTILTLAPTSWSRKKKLWPISGHAKKWWGKSDSLRNTPASSRSQCLSKVTPGVRRERGYSDVLQKWHNFLCDAQEERCNLGNQMGLMMTNLKNRTRIEGREHKNQRRFCVFAFLRPFWCVLAGSPWRHVVCVCTYDENVKLMFNSTEIKGSYAV